jgi:O-antigen/teichoic acid export membrane protein
MSEKIFAQGFGLAVFAVQAPLLGPHAFGMLAAVMVFVGFQETVPGAAALDALISVRAIEPRHYSTVNLLMILLGACMGCGLWAFAGPLAAWLGDAHLVPVMHAMAAVPLIQSLTTVPSAAAQRNMLFRQLTQRTIASQVAGGTVGLVAAIAGAGVWALVWQALVQRGVAALVLWLSVSPPFSMRFSRRHCRELLTYALPNIVSRVMSWSSGQVPRLIIGLYLGTTGLGVFTFATRLNDLVTQVAILPKTLVARVDLRRFADSPAALGQAVGKVFFQVSLLAYPLCVGGAVIMVPLVHSWLDPRWRDAIVPSQILLLTCIPFATIYTSAALLLALNRQRWEAVICTVQSLATALAVAALARQGVIAAAIGMAAASVLIVPLVVYVMRRSGGVGLRHVVPPQMPALLASAFMAAAVLLVRWRFEAVLGEPATLPLAVGVGAAAYSVALLVVIPRQIGRAWQRVSHIVASRP